MIGFDYARTFNPRSRRGRRWASSTSAGSSRRCWWRWAIGVVLGRAGGYTPEAFRIAWTVQYAVWAFAVVAVLVARRRARRKLEADGVVILSLRAALAQRRARRR